MREEIRERTRRRRDPSDPHNIERRRIAEKRMMDEVIEKERSEEAIAADRLPTPPLFTVSRRALYCN
jgi:hypothetical protein